jgi:hypothetical protein
LTLIEKLPHTAAVNPLAVADKLYVPALLTERLLNLATPFTAFTVVVPERAAPPGPLAIAMVIAAPAYGPPPTNSPLLVSVATVTTGGDPAPNVPAFKTIEPGDAVNPNCVAASAARLQIF